VHFARTNFQLSAKLQQTYPNSVWVSTLEVLIQGEGGVSQFFLRLKSSPYGNMPNFKIVAYLLLGCTDSGGFVKFTPKYVIVKWGVLEFF
jgi:hypothetical protein